MDNIKLSQNFLRNSKTVEELIKLVEIKGDDIILEIGAGKGIITEQLLKKTKKVYAIEPDEKLLTLLAKKFSKEISNNKLILAEKRFQEYFIPSVCTKIFSNIPFQNSTEIITKILNYRPIFIRESYLIVQKEVAIRFGGDDVSQNAFNTMLSVIYRFYFDFQIIQEIPVQEFTPIPNVPIVLLKISRKAHSHKTNKDQSVSEFEKFRDFVAYIFHNSKPNKNCLDKFFTYKQLIKLRNSRNLTVHLAPSNISYENYFFMYKFIVENSKGKLLLAKNAYKKINKESKEIKKIYRTRLDKDWKSKLKNQNQSFRK